MMRWYFWFALSGIAAASWLVACLVMVAYGQIDTSQQFWMAVNVGLMLLAPIALGSVAIVLFIDRMARLGRYRPVLGPSVFATAP